MDSIAGYATTGRTLKGPASDLVELKGERGQTLSAIVFHPEYREHRGINGALEVVARFLEDPMVPDLVEMVGRDTELGAFVYPTGQVWAVADVIRILADLGETAGVRAGLELMHKAGTVLSEAADFGLSENVYSHGGLTPWRLVMRQDGRVLIIGHALPQVEILMFHEDHSVLPPSDSFRYCPPERIHGEEEDLTSDLFSLCLIAFEFMTGKPVYDGLVNDIRAKAARGEASQVLFRARDSLPAVVRDILGNSMRLEKHDRFACGADFLDAVASALGTGDARGPSLADVMRKVSSQMQRRGVVPDAASTVMGTPEEIRAMLQDDDEADEPAREAWQPASRVRRPRRAKEAEPTSTSDPAPPAAASRSPEQEGEGRWSNTLRRSGTRRSVRRVSTAAEPQEVLSPSADLADGVVAASEAESRPRFERPAPGRRGVRRSSAADGPTPEPVGREPESAESRVEEVLRSSRVRRPRRSRVSASTPPEAEAVAAPSATSAPSERLESPGASGREASTSDLLARIRQSATRSRGASVDRPSAASDIIRELARSSGRRQKPVSSAAAPPPEPSESAPDPSPAPEEGAGRVRRVRRARREGAPVDAAAEVLSPPEAAPPVSPPAESPSAPGGASVSAPPPDSVPETGRSVSTKAGNEPVRRPSEPTAAGDAAVVEPVDTTPPPRERTPERPPPGHGRESVVVDFCREPVAIPPGSRGGAQTFVVRRGPASRGTRMRLPKEATVAEALAWVVPNLVPVRVDLTGRLSGWYRLKVDGKPIPAGTRMGELDPEKPLLLYTVPNTTRLVELTIEGDRPVRMVAPMGVAIPVVSLVDHLTVWHGLSGAHQLWGPAGPLEPHAILADLQDQTGALSLSLRPSDSGETS